jgi:hypothetical protein
MYVTGNEKRRNYMDSSAWFRSDDQTPAESFIYLGCYSICEEVIQVIG